MEKIKKWEDIYRFLEARRDDYVLATFLQYAVDIRKESKTVKTNEYITIKLAGNKK